MNYVEVRLKDNFLKKIFLKISDIYLKITNNNDIYINFEAEEIIHKLFLNFKY